MADLTVPVSRPSRRKIDPQQKFGAPQSIRWNFVPTRGQAIARPVQRQQYSLCSQAQSIQVTRAKMLGELTLELHANFFSHTD